MLETWELAKSQKVERNQKNG